MAEGSKTLLSRTIRCFPALALSCAVLLPAAQATQLSAARLWSSPEYTRLTLEADGPIGYRLFTVQDPPRLVVDLEDAHGAKMIETVASQLSPLDPYVRAVRVGRFKPGVVRVVLDLKADVQPQAYPLPPAKEFGHRLVLDVHPVAAPDALMALIGGPNTAATPVPAKVAAAPSSTSPTAVPSAVAVNTSPAAVQPAPATASKGAEVPPSSAVTVAPSSQAAARKTAEIPSPDKSATAKPATVAAPKPATPAPSREDDRMERLITVAVDAGHGGEDPGARGASGTYEKAVTLAIARRLKASIDEIPNMRAVLVRDADVFIPLHQRVIKARNVQADLFVSIHADAYIKPHAKGSSVFALSERGATSAAARWLAKRENDADLIGGVNIDVPDPNLKKVLLDLSQTATINDSLKLGRAVLSELSEVNSLHKHRVEQAGFAVLKAPDMPSILVETAFISNPDEEERLNDEDYQIRLAGAIATGIRQYFAKNPPLARARMARSDSPRSPFAAPARSAEALADLAPVDATIALPPPAASSTATAGFRRAAYTTTVERRTRHARQATEPVVERRAKIEKKSAQAAARTSPHKVADRSTAATRAPSHAQASSCDREGRAVKGSNRRTCRPSAAARHSKLRIR